VIAEVVERNRAAFDLAAGRLGATTLDVDVVGERVRVAVAGSPLADALLPALRHRATTDDDRPVALDVVAWDEEGSGVPLSIVGLPPAPDQPEARTAVLGDGGFAMVQGVPPFAAQAHDARTATAFLWVRSVDELLRWGERTKPLLELLHSWLLPSAWQPVHAAAVAGPAGGVLLAGPSGSGKSTTALACVEAGWSYAGDDFVAVTPGPPVARVENLYCSARLKPDMARRLGTFGVAEVGTVHINGVEKRDFVLDGHVDPGVIGGFPVRAVLLPRVNGVERSTIRPASAADALRGMAAYTMHLLRVGAADAFRKLGLVAEAVPAFHLELGPDLDRLPELIDSTAWAPA
jgi:hypothetical protein